MGSSVKLTIYFLKSGQGHKNTASYNRFLMLKQMCEKHFETQVVGFNSFDDGKHKKSRLLNAFAYRFNLIAVALKVPASGSKQKNILFLLSTDPFLFLLVWIIAKLKGNKIINERNEFPETIRKGIKWRVWIYKNFVLWWQYRLMDGLFLMTDELIRFYAPHTKKSCIIQKLPMTVDFARFAAKPGNQSSVKYVFYAGSFSQKKDGVQCLMRAFNAVKDQLPDLELWLAGGKKQNRDTHELKELITSLNLDNKVKLLGELKRDEIPGYLMNAHVLVLPRPDSIQARGGFPTKLGEYLASGKPVIATNVGEIPNYLTEKEAFLISPDHIENELAERIIQISKDYAHALEIAKQGQKRAFECFSTEVNAEKMRQLILKIS
jgi:glycosyltransferase involved in cell wall biosynthesis